MRLGALLIRAIVGPLFIGHGTQKLFGWFGGHGPDATGQAFEGMGLRPGKRHAMAAGAAEAGGGALLTLGALTPIGATLITGTMVTAIRKVHYKNGPWVTEGGFEYNAVLIGLVTALVDHGAGPLSVDGAAFPRLKGSALAAASLAAGIAGSYLITSERMQAPGPAPAEGEAELAGDPASNGKAPQPEPTHA